MEGVQRVADAAGLERLGLGAELARVGRLLDDWVAACDPDVRELVAYQLGGSAKRFRPATVLACHRAGTGGGANGAGAPETVVRAAAAIELLHNWTLIADDFVDRDTHRRGRLALHARFGPLPAIMAAAYVAFGAATLVLDDRRARAIVYDLGQRMLVAECRQWRLRGRGLELDEWRRLAGEDTGSMFEASARLALPDDRLGRFGYLLGMLYHGCDDIADVRGSAALGSASDRDVSDRILTLPAALAVRDPETRALFESSGDGDDDDGALVERLAAVLDDAEAVLDELAADAEREARANARDPEPLLELVRSTRALSRA
jgi:geranylgeranyl pyrophosphate synthase